ncbi:MAG: CotH kinase family protein [Oscillospiraceae bacterium]
MMKRKHILRLLVALLTTSMLFGACSDSAESVTESGNNSTADSQTQTTGEDDGGTDVPPRIVTDATVDFSSAAGVYADAFDLTITASESGKIYYTTDGSDPVTSTTRVEYTAPIPVKDRSADKNVVAAVDPGIFDAAHDTVNASRDGFETSSKAPADSAVDKCTVIRAAVADASGNYSAVKTATYFIGAMDSHISGIQSAADAWGKDLAVVSISVNYDDLFSPDTGIYVKGNIYNKALLEYINSGENLEAETSRSLDANYKQKGSDWERAVHVDFFEADASAASLVLSQDCGVRIQGNYSRSDLQKGLRLYARSDYGEKNFKYAVFGDTLTNDAGEVMDKFDTLTLRAGGNCAFTTKYSDTYWTTLAKDLNCDTLTSRPCVVYINGEYWGAYVLQEDFSDDFFSDTHGVDKDTVVSYKGDAESLKLGYKLDVGKIPDGESESYYFSDLLSFFRENKSLESDEAYEAFSKLVDVESCMDYFAAEIWVNNKWDWPGKNWSMWRTTAVENGNAYADGRWRFMFYDMEFGGVSGSQDAYTNTIKEDNYKRNGLLDMDTDNPAVLCYAYLMTNAGFREQFAERLTGLSTGAFAKDTAMSLLDKFNASYSPLYDQFFARFPGSGTTQDAVSGDYASYQCIKDFLNLRADHIQTMLDWAEGHYN